MLDHNNIAPLYGVFSKWAGGYPAFVLEWFENGTANEYLEKRPDADAISIVCRLVLPLQHNYSYFIRSRV